jgi:hypothetical protein
MVKSKASRKASTAKFIASGNYPHEYIADEAAKIKSMIIMGRRGRTGLMRVMMGSVTAKVLGHTLCRLVVPKDAKLSLKNTYYGRQCTVSLHPGSHRHCKTQRERSDRPFRCQKRRKSSNGKGMC